MEQDRFVGLRMSSEKAEAIERIAETLGLNVSEFIRQAIESTITATDPEYLQGSRELLESWRLFHREQRAERAPILNQLKLINERLDEVLKQS